LIGTTAEHSLKLAKNGVIELAKEMGNNLLPVATEGLKVFNSLTGDVGGLMKSHPVGTKVATLGVAGAGAGAVVGAAILAPAAQIAQYFQLQKLLNLQKAALGLETVGAAATSGATALRILTGAATGLGIAMTTVMLLEDMKAEGLATSHFGFALKGPGGKDKLYEMMYGTDFNPKAASQREDISMPTPEHLLFKDIALPASENLALPTKRYDSNLGAMFGDEKNAWGRGAITVFQTNQVSIDAAGMNPDELKQAFDKRTRSEAERGVTGKN